MEHKSRFYKVNNHYFLNFWKHSSDVQNKISNFVLHKNKQIKAYSFRQKKWVNDMPLSSITIFVHLFSDCKIKDSLHLQSFLKTVKAWGQLCTQIFQPSFLQVWVIWPQTSILQWPLQLFVFWAGFGVQQASCVATSFPEAPAVISPDSTDT